MAKNVAAKFPLDLELQFKDLSTYLLPPHALSKACFSTYILDSLHVLKVSLFKAGPHLRASSPPGCPARTPGRGCSAPAPPPPPAANPASPGPSWGSWGAGAGGAGGAGGAPGHEVDAVVDVAEDVLAAVVLDGRVLVQPDHVVVYGRPGEPEELEGLGHQGAHQPPHLLEVAGGVEGGQHPRGVHHVALGRGLPAGVPWVRRIQIRNLYGKN